MSKINTAQFASFIRGLFKAGGAALVAHGLTQGRITEWLIGLAPTIAGFLWSHFVHADTPTTSSAGTPTVPPTVKMLLVAGLSLAFVGCGTFVTETNKTIYAGTMLSDGGMKTYATWYKDKTNSLNGTTLAIETQRTNVMQLSVRVGGGLALADKSLKAYQGRLGTNTATKAVVVALVGTAVSEAGDFAVYVGGITGDTNLTHAFPMP